MTMFKLKPSEVKKEILQDMEAKLVPFVKSSPGIGKSSVVRQIADSYDLKVIDLRLSQCAPEDLMGLPMRIGEGREMKAAFAPFEMFPTEGDELPEGKNGWILFLDEFNSATKMVQAAAYKLALDRMIGQAHLHENCFVVCAGNLAADRAIVTQMSTAMQSRLMHYEMVTDMAEFMKHAAKNKFDPRVLGFLEFQPGKLHDFDPDHQDNTFPCPRTWEFVSKKIRDRATDEISVAGVAAAIGDGTAVEFYAFMEEYANLPEYRKIIADPENIKVPSKQSTSYAIMTMMLDKFTKDTFPAAATYVKRFTPEFQVVYFRGVIAREPTMFRDPKFTAVITHLTNFLHEEDDTAQAA